MTEEAFHKNKQEGGLSGVAGMDNNRKVLFKGNDDNNYLNVISIDKLNFNKIRFIKKFDHSTLLITEKNEMIKLEKDGTFTITNISNLIRGEIKVFQSSTSFALIVNEFNELFFQGYLNERFNFKEFTKIFDLNIDSDDIVKFIRCNRVLFVVTKKNILFVLGSNFQGQLGIKDLDKRNKINNLTKIENLNLQIKDIQLGFCHSFLLDKSGFIYGTGCNEYEKINYLFTQELPNSIFITNYNNIYFCGDNYFNRFGLLYNDCKEIKQFTKLNNFKTTDKYLIPLLSYQLLIFTSHYKINGEEDSNNNEEIITNYQLNKLSEMAMEELRRRAHPYEQLTKEDKARLKALSRQIPVRIDDFIKQHNLEPKPLDVLEKSQRENRREKRKRKLEQEKEIGKTMQEKSIIRNKIFQDWISNNLYDDVNSNFKEEPSLDKKPFTSPPQFVNQNLNVLESYHLLQRESFFVTEWTSPRTSTHFPKPLLKQDDKVPKRTSAFLIGSTNNSNNSYQMPPILKKKGSIETNCSSEILQKTKNNNDSNTSVITLHLPRIV
ncbi:hypothetical protein ABK040_014071 [Willaertia magna]